MIIATHGDVVRVLSSVFNTAQSNTRNRVFNEFVTENKSGAATF